MRSVANIVEALGDEFDFRIVCSDRDVLDERPYVGIAFDKWTAVGKAHVFYASSKTQSVSGWCRLIRDLRPDVIYLNSLFNPTFTIKPLLARALLRLKIPVALAPRGELSPGALAIKWWKKTPFLAVVLRRLYRDVLWHASTEQEAELIRAQVGLKESVGVVENIVIARDLHAMLPAVSERPSASVGQSLRVVFLARISRMKNLEFALQVLSQCRAAVQFDIWGTIEDEAYWAACQAVAKGLPSNVTVFFKGAAAPNEAMNVLSTYDLLFLPTRGENYGHVIAEALAVGTAVLISDQTPWRNLHDAGVGWDLPLANQKAFCRAIEAAARKDYHGRLDWRRRIRAYATKRLADPRLIEANRQVFRIALSAARQVSTA